MTLLAPVAGTLRGIKVYLEGVRWLRAHPSYLLLLMVPVTIGVLFLAGGLTLLAHYDHAIMERVLFDKPEGFFYLALYYVCQVLLYLAIVLLTFLASFLVMNVVAAPIYEVVSTAVERDVTGESPPPLGLLGSLRVMLVELKKVALILFVSLVLLLIPGLNVVSTVFAAFLVGWDFFDYPVARRGWSLGVRVARVGRNGWAVLGLGLWLVIPFVQILTLPLAVAGGTLLNLEAQGRRPDAGQSRGVGAPPAPHSMTS
jgi:uncharacterized protein involved in cysteine biosynthesis